MLNLLDIVSELVYVIQQVSFVHLNITKFKWGAIEGYSVKTIWKHFS